MITPMPEGMCLLEQPMEKETNDLGTVYVTSVSGPKQYKLDLNQIKSYKADGYRRDNAAEQTQFFQVVTVEKNSLVYVAYTALGEEYDRAVITKDFDTGKKETLSKPEVIN